MTDAKLPQGGDRYGIGKGSIVRLSAVVVFSLLIVTLLWVWFGWRITVGPGEYVVLVNKTGKDLSNAEILAMDGSQKGVQREILKEGRHFRNPFFYQWTGVQRATVIEADFVGVRVRQYGKPLPEGEVVTPEASPYKGILAEPLKPGRYYINKFMETVTTVPAVKVPSGHRGVVTLRAGRPPKDPNAFVVAAGERGVQQEMLPPGTHYVNPFVKGVTVIDIRSHKFEMSGSYSVTFPSEDGFDIVVEGTCEWAPQIDRVPEIFVKFVDEADLKRSGGIDNIQAKLILPYARSFCRLVGSRHLAVDFIKGETRTEFQEDVLKRLKQACGEQGIDIRSLVIRATRPPQEIRDQFRMREVARRELEQFGNEILREQERIQQQLKELEKGRQSELGDVRQTIAQLVRKAEENQEVKLTQARQRLEVAKMQLEAAKNQAAAIRSEGLAAAAVKVMENTAEANAIRAEVEAFGDGQTFADFKLLSKLAPSVQRIFSNTEGPFAELFQRFTAPPPAPQPAPAQTEPARAASAEAAAEAPAESAPAEKKTEEVKPSENEPAESAEAGSGGGEKKGGE